MATKPKTQGLPERVKRLLKRGRYVVVSLIALAFFGVTGAEWFRNWGALPLVEMRAHDLRFSWRYYKKPSPEVAVVAIMASSFDQKGLAELGEESEAVRMMSENTWPWPRNIHARVIDRLFEAGARAVAVDFAFPNEREGGGDDELARVLEKYRGRVVLATIVQKSKDSAGRDQVALYYPHSRFTNAAGPNSSGIAAYSNDSDATVRRFDFRTSDLREAGIDDDSRDIPHFAVRAVELFTEKQQRSDYKEIIDYAGPPSTYPYIPVEEIFIDRIFRGDSPIYSKGTVFDGKLVFYGPIAEIFHDVHQTPFGVMPGVEIHAQIAGALLEGRRVRDASNVTSHFLAFTSAACAVLIVLLLKNPLWQSLGLLCLCGGLLGFAELTFIQWNLMFPMVPGFLTALGTGAFGIVFLFLLEQWDKAHTRKVLERSVSKRIAKVVLQNAEEFNLARKGARRSVAILFSDIRGFTTWSESAEPEHLVGQLNEYFEKMVDLIESEVSMGNAQKFIGDAILAAWGDTPENQFGEAEDARRAVATALRMRTALKELNVTWDARPDRSVIQIGIGINIGTVVVGEVGHPERGEYTVLGDGVNFAARLESATKQFHTDCLVGENVEALTRGKFVYRHADFIRVKGKTKPVNVFYPLSEAGSPPPEWLADYHRARGLYLDRKFFEAAELFANVKARIGGEDFLCDLYLKQCTHFAQATPPSDWDGSRELTEK